MHTRPAVLADAPQLLDIYNHEVQTSIVTFDLVPRTLAEQEAFITDRSGAHLVLVATEDPTPGGPLLGFGALSPYRERPGYSTTVEDSVYVHRDHRGAGVGRVLLDAVLDAARAHGFHAVIARIVAGHEASITLHARAGFEIVGHEKEVGRKFGRWHDVVLMECLL